MDCCRLENAPGVFLPNDKAAGKSGGLLVYRWSFIVSRFGCQMLTHLPLNMKNRRAVSDFSFTPPCHPE